MELLLKQFRNQVLENVHFGDICIVDQNEKVIYSYGDVNTETIYRSCSKPLQLLPLIINGGIEKYQLNEKEIAIMCSSHHSEPMHIEILDNLLKKANINEDELYCPKTFPGYLRTSALKEIKPYQKRKLHMNCSGKHIGLILSSQILNYDYKDYYKVDHPVQKDIIKIIKEFSSFDGEVKIGIDGCGVPVYTVDLKGCAIAFMKLAKPEVLNDNTLEESVIKIVDSINNNPLLLRGTNTLDEIINSDRNLIGKVGAQGLYTVGLKDEGLGIAYKMYDGNENNQAFVLANILKKIDYKNQDTINNLLKLCDENVYNYRKDIVGKREVTF